MLQNAKFNLATVSSVSTCDDLGIRKFGGTSGWILELEELVCQIQSDHTAVAGSFDETNNKICTFLAMRLADQFPRNLWKLSLEFSTAPSGIFKITASGQILEQLQSMMSYGSKGSELKLMFSADLHSRKKHSLERKLTANYRAELHPLLGSENCFNHSTYLDTEGPNAVFEIKSVDNIKIWIEGIKKKIAKTNSTSCIQLLREKGFGSELTIQYKVANDEEELKKLSKAKRKKSCESLINVQENVLIAQSPVIKTMLEKDKFTEGATRTISMTNWTKEEVTAFIHYLYFGDLELALNNSKLAVTLYEMAHYYDVTSLERALKTVLLNMTSEAGPCKPDDCIRLFNIADSAKDDGLKQMAVDMFKLYAGQQSGESLVEGFLSNEVMSQEMLLMCMKP